MSVLHPGSAVELTHALLENCFLTGNTLGSAGAAVVIDWQGDVIVRGCTIYGNPGADGSGIDFETDSADPPDPVTIEKNIVSHNGGDATGGNFTLDAHSPYLPGRNPYGEDCGLVGALDIGCGATATQSGTWGAVKQLFR
jgi:hypothetical protein